MPWRHGRAVMSTQPSNAPHSLCRNVVPIAALFSGTLWLGNAAYLYLSVAFIQMLKVSRSATAYRYAKRT